MQTRPRVFAVAISLSAVSVLSACGQGKPQKAAEPDASAASTAGEDIGGTLNLSIGLEPQQAVIFGQNALSRPSGNAPLVSGSAIDSSLEELPQDSAVADTLPPN